MLFGNQIFRGPDSVKLSDTFKSHMCAGDELMSKEFFWTQDILGLLSERNVGAEWQHCAKVQAPEGEELGILRKTTTHEYLMCDQTVSWKSDIRGKSSREVMHGLNAQLKGMKDWQVVKSNGESIIFDAWLNDKTSATDSLGKYKKLYDAGFPFAGEEREGPAEVKISQGDFYYKLILLCLHILGGSDMNAEVLSEWILKVLGVLNPITENQQVALDYFVNVIDVVIEQGDKLKGKDAQEVGATLETVAKAGAEVSQQLKGRDTPEAARKVRPDGSNHKNEIHMRM